MKIDKYKVSQELMNAIDEWTDGLGVLIVIQDLSVEGGELPSSIYAWWMDTVLPSEESNNRLIALIRYVNGEDTFEVEKPKKWIVRSKKRTWDDYKVVVLFDDNVCIPSDSEQAFTMRIDDGLRYAFKFNTREEAEKWTNPLMEVVEWEVEDD